MLKLYGHHNLPFKYLLGELGRLEAEHIATLARGAPQDTNQDTNNKLIAKQIVLAYQTVFKIYIQTGKSSQALDLAHTFIDHSNIVVIKGDDGGNDQQTNNTTTSPITQYNNELYENLIGHLIVTFESFKLTSDKIPELTLQLWSLPQKQLYRSLEVIVSLSLLSRNHHIAEFYYKQQEKRNVLPNYLRLVLWIYHYYTHPSIISHLQQQEGNDQIARWEETLTRLNIPINPASS
ncbi:hypothetical protein DFA_07725 [Cavenderia fasciculata]|uniref:Uncharacterized protein n=1 Tax=Cavenderia fasciculata TaxID=261658 RepID=F4Q325_CACFS|nr:uncharacterized protein DFA_07725 [Cavenderia fasciculata]EGG16747.1 hypothetical protein DFA_07725 [Cavenderia fasciculata]|eukprot:XP_004355221.1 hypothetical protein DFA_07725 [Cavenderia fasciculata]